MPRNLVYPHVAQGLIGDRDVLAAALLMVKRYRDDAMREAEARAQQLEADGDADGAEIWHGILNAIERLQSTKPADGESVQ